MIDIPNTALTATMRALWGLRFEIDSATAETFEEFYLRHCAEGFGLGRPASVNGRALAALLFDRALTYWPDFFSPADLPAVAVWGEIFDSFPLLTPEVIEQVVDAVAASGRIPHSIGDFLPLARKLTETGGC